MKSFSKAIKILSLVIITLYTTQQVSADTLNISPLQDTFVISIGDKNKLGNDLLVINMNQLGYQIVAKSLLKFDLTSIPKDAVIDSAELKLYNNKVNGNNPHVKVSLYNNNNWNKDVTWSDLAPGISTFLSEQVLSNTGYYSWDVKQSMNNDLITLLLESNSDNMAAAFSSTSSSDNIPVLNVLYTPISTNILDTISVGGDTHGTIGNSASIYINATGASDIGSIQLDILYDPSIIKANNVIVENLATGAETSFNIDNDIGSTTIGMMNTAGISGSGSLVKIEYDIMGTGKSDLNVSVKDVTDINNNKITVGKIVNSTFSAILQKGDINKDGKITSGDALLYLRYAVGQDINPYTITESDDVTCDSRITSADALKILRKAVGQEVNFICT